MAKRRFERRPGIFIHEEGYSRTERIRWTMDFVAAAIVLLGAAAVFLIVPDLSESIGSDLAAMCFVFSWLPTSSW